MTHTQIIGMILLVGLGYAALAWTLTKMRAATLRADLKASAIRHEEEALRAKYFTPALSEAQIAELHASRWQGD